MMSRKKRIKDPQISKTMKWNTINTKAQQDVIWSFIKLLKELLIKTHIRTNIESSNISFKAILTSLSN